MPSWRTAPNLKLKSSPQQAGMQQDDIFSPGVYSGLDPTCLAGYSPEQASRMPLDGFCNQFSPTSTTRTVQNDPFATSSSAAATPPEGSVDRGASGQGLSRSQPSRTTFDSWRANLPQPDKTRMRLCRSPVSAVLLDETGRQRLLETAPALSCQDTRLPRSASHLLREAGLHFRAAEHLHSRKRVTLSRAQAHLPHADSRGTSASVWRAMPTTPL